MDRGVRNWALHWGICGRVTMDADALPGHEERPAAGSSQGNTAPYSSTEMDRKARAYLSASRHSSRVRILKFALPVLGGAFIGIFYLLSHSVDIPTGTIELGSGTVRNGKIVMANPVLKGYTKDNLSYRMTAERAIQDVGNTDTVNLENIRATIPIDKHNTATIGAASGSYDNKSRTLKVDSPLTVSTTDGMKVRLQSAFIEMKSGSLRTEKPVEIEQNGSQIKAQSMNVEDNGRILVFEKNVRLTISPDQMKSAQETGQGQESGDAD
jgi:lipopolysaccharide export system protein LptC